MDVLKFTLAIKQSSNDQLTVNKKTPNSLVIANRVPMLGAVNNKLNKTLRI